MAKRAREESGQASLELLGSIPLLLLAGLACLQLLVAGYSLTLADGAAEAGALALAADAEPRPAIDAALPDWAQERLEVERSGGQLTVRLRPPAPISALSRVLEVSSSAWVRRPGGGG
jgi:hypothetical protein